MIKLIEETKNSIKEGIEEERKVMNEKYDDNIKAVEHITSIPNAIKELVNIYGNTLPQRDKMIQILTQYLKADFFKSATIVPGANYIYFNNGNYSVAFATSRIYNVKLSRNDYVRKPIQPLPIREDILRFDKFWNHYQSTGEGYDDLVEEYSQMKRAMPAGFLFKLRVKKSDIEELANSHKKHIKNVNEYIDKWREEMREVDKEKELFNSIVEDIREDLTNFKSDGWRLSYENLENLGEHEI